MDFKKLKVNTNFFTIWEDHTEIKLDDKFESQIVDFEENDQYHILEKASSKNTDDILLEAFIPEYYSIKGKINGNFDFTKPN